MRTMNKSSSMPSLAHQAPQKGMSTKPRKHKLQELQNQVSKSRIAVENMSHTRAIQTSLYNQIQELQRQLHRCILSLNSESEKQKTLIDLTTILKGEMSAVQAMQKTSAEFVSSGIEKKIKKVEYDIKQILHKSNEEIAKINLLKEQANASRDERVVYSNLFNKIEKEIKHYEQIYKQTVIKNEIFLDKKRSQSFQNNQDCFDNDMIDQSLDRNETVDIKETKEVKTNQKDKSKEHSRSIKVNDGNGLMGLEYDPFLTNPRQWQIKPIVQNHNYATAPSHHRDGSSTPQKNNSQSKGIENAIKSKQAAIEAIIVHAQCRSKDECFKVFCSLDEKNDQLTRDITQLDENIDYIEHQMERILKQKRSSEVYENRQFSEIVNISKKSRSNKAAIKEYGSHHSQHEQALMHQICDILKIDPQNLGDQVLREIDTKIDDLGPVVIKKHERRESRQLFSEQIGDRNVYDLLEKIDKFGESEKIFDKNMLRAEYHKQLNKVRKRAKRSN